MGMRIRTNVSSINAQRFLTQSSQSMSQSLERLSSGYRINKSADDAAGLAISENIRGKVRGLNQAKRNASDAISMVQTAEGSMGEMTNIMIRLRELTVQSASDTIGETERGYLNREYTQLVDEVDRIIGTTEFNGRKLFSKEEADQFVIQVGTNGTPPEANIDTLTVNLGGMKITTEDLGLGKLAEIGPTAEEGAVGPSRDEIATKLTSIDNALMKLSGERANLGATQSRLNSAVANLGTSVENMETAKSRISDVDFAAETAALTQNKILVQSGTAVLAQANQSPEAALALLRG
jgi:flagellin